MKHIVDPMPSHRRGVYAALVAVFLTCAIVLAACGGSTSPNATSSNTPKKGGNIVVGLIAEPTTMDPLTSVSLYDTDVMSNMYDTLLKYDLNNQIQPELASYAYASPTVLNLTLRTGVKFHDGTPFNADAVIFNLNRFINDKAAPRYTDVVNIASVIKMSDSQVQIKLKKPFSPLLNVLTGDVGMELSPAAIQKLGSTKLANAPVGAGSGPFQFVEWIKGDHLLLKANPNFWKKDAQGNALPYLQSIRFHTITDDNVMYSNLVTSQIQVASTINPNQIAQVKSNSSLTYRQIAGPGFTSIQINTSVPPLNNVHVRRAIAWAINRQEIVDHVLQGVGTVAHGPLSPASWAYDKNYAGFTYDVSKAKAELAQSGIAGNISFDLLITSNSSTLTQEAQFIQSQLQAVNITVNIKQEVFTTLVQDFQTFHYQTLIVGWTGSLDPDGTIFPMFDSQGGFNYTKNGDPQVDALLDAARLTSDQTTRTTDYQQAQQLIVNDASRVFIFHPAVYQATTSAVKNYALYPSQVIDLTSVYLSS